MMRRLQVCGGAALALVLGAGAAGCDKSNEAPETGEIQAVQEAPQATPKMQAGEAKAPSAETTEVSVLGVPQVSTLLDQGAAVYDANTDETRAQYGVVPGAVLLDSSSSYDLSVLPQDKAKQLVFYCANTRCSASDAAAHRAAEAGYQKVAVMRPGIKGWADAGKPTDHPKS